MRGVICGCAHECALMQKSAQSHTQQTQILTLPLSSCQRSLPKTHAPTHTLIFIYFYYYYYFIFCLLHSLCQILVPRPGIEPTLHPLEGEVVITGPPRKSLLLIFLTVEQKTGFPGSSAGEESACTAGNSGLNPGLEGSPG